MNEFIMIVMGRLLVYFIASHFERHQSEYWQWSCNSQVMELQGCFWIHRIVSLSHLVVHRSILCLCYC